MKRLFAAVAITLSPSVAHAEDVHVGKIPVVCPATITRAEGFVQNAMLKVTPEEAVAAAEKAGRVKCNSKLLQEVSADNKNYYIRRFGSADVVVVDGQTKAVSVRKPK